MTNNEALGPAERIVQTILHFPDHMVHNRPGLLVADPTSPIGVRWYSATYRVEPADGTPLPRLPRGQRRPPIENGVKVAYRLDKVGDKTVRTRVGLLGDDCKVRDGGRLVGEYRQAGLFPEVAAWIYRQVADVWKIDNEFCARWASHAYAQDHRDLKVVLAAFMLCQSRRGDPVVEGGKVIFHDEDYRDVGEAMMLIYDGKSKGKTDQSLRVKLLVRIRELLSLPAVAQINRDLGFGRSARHPFYGRWDKAVEKWLRHREDNPKLLEGLVRTGSRTTVCELAKIVGSRCDAQEAFKASIGVLQLEYMTNRRIVSAYVGGPHGWCDWSGRIGCDSYNIGKWPSTEVILDEWRAIADAFPYLRLRCQLFSGEQCEEGVVPVIEYVVERGNVRAVEPAGAIRLPRNDDVDFAALSNPGRERGCTIDQLRRAVGIARASRDPLRRAMRESMRELAEDDRK